MTQIVETPIGEIEFPDEMSKEEIQIVLEAQLGAPAPKQQSQQQEQNDSTWIERNLDFPAGVAGSLAGAQLGVPLGVPGIVAGSVIGGAVGTFGGSVASDLLTEEEVSFTNAIRDAGISAGIDVATLGLGKVLKPAFSGTIKKLFGEGKTPEQALEELARGADAPVAGTPESIAQTQKFLSERGATLTPMQAGIEGSAAVSERIARISLLGSGKIENNAQAVNDIVSKYLTEVINGNVVNRALDSDTLGRTAFEIISDGKRAISESYDKELTDIVTQIGSKRAPISPVVSELDAFLKKYEAEGIGNVLTDETRTLITNLRGQLGSNGSFTVPVSSLIELDKLITRKVSDFSDVRSQTFNSNVSRELTELSNSLKNRIKTLIGVVSPEEAAKYGAAKKAYSEGMQGVLPKINESFVNQANKDRFDSLGKLMAGSGSLSQISALKESIEEAYKRAGTSASVPKQEAEALMRRAYLEKLFPDFPSGVFDGSKYATEVKRMQRPDEVKRMQMILGDDYVSFKRLLNVMYDSALKPGTSLGEFVLRGQEYKQLAQVLQAGAVGGGVTTMSTLGIAGAAALLTVPRFLASVSTNPKTVNKMIAVANANYKDPTKAQAALASLVGDAWNLLDDDEKQKVIENAFAIQNKKGERTPQ